MNNSRQTWTIRREAWSRALRSALESLPKENKVRLMAGSLAWGRYDGEPCAADGKDNTVFGCGVLQGSRSILLDAARRLKDDQAEKLMAGVAGEAWNEINRRSKEAK